MLAKSNGSLKDRKNSKETEAMLLGTGEREIIIMYSHVRFSNIVTCNKVVNTESTEGAGII